MFLNTRWAAIVVSILMTFKGTAAWSQTTAPETPPVPASQPAAKTLKFTDAPLAEVLNAFAEQWSFIIIKPPTLPGRVTLTLDKSLTSTQVAGMLNDLLKPFGYESLASRTTDPNPRTILRIVPSFTNGKSQIPVSYGRDPAKIEINDKLITQVIPLEHLDTASARKELEPLLSPNAYMTTISATTNVIVVTDTAAKVRQIVETVLKIDRDPSTATAPATTSH